MIEAAIQQFYADQDPPPEIHVPVAPVEQQLLEDWLARRPAARFVSSSRSAATRRG